jgi:2-haloacid dehalogenase
MDDVRVLAFDVFGTVVDWHGGIVREVQRLGLPVPAGDFAREWRAGYEPIMDEVRQGQRPWTTLDDLHLELLDRLLRRYGVTTMAPREREALNRVWHRLDPWPDALEALGRLKSRYILTTLSNGHVALLVNMAKRSGLPWDCVLSAQIFSRYKPDPATYLGVARLLDVAPSSVMMVAAHANDLRAARACGLRTAFVERPLEEGPDTPYRPPPEVLGELRARDLLELARQLGC